MAESDVIRSEDVIEKEILKAFNEEGRESVEIMKELEAALKAVLSASQKRFLLIEPKTLEDVERLNNEVETLKRRIAELTTVQKTRKSLEERLAQLQTHEAQQAAKLNEQIRQRNLLNKERAKLMTSEEGSLNQLRATLTLLRKEYDSLTEAQRNNAQIGGLLLTKIQQLDGQVKTLEVSTGRHQRNVGNYTGALKGMGAIIGNTAKLFGVQTEAIVALELGFQKVVKILKGFKAVMAAATAATEAQTASVQTLTIVQRIYNFVATASAGVIGLLVAGGVALIAGITALVMWLTSASDAEKERQKTVDGTIIKNDELRKQYNDLIDVIKELDIEYELLTGAMTKQEAAAARLVITTDKIFRSFRENTRKALEETTGFWASVKSHFGASALVINEQMQIISENAAITARELKRVVKQAIIEKEKEKQRIEELELEKWREIQRLQADAISDENQRKRAQLRLQAQFDIEDTNRLEVSENTKYNLIVAINARLVRELADINAKIEEERQRHLDKLNEMEMRALKDIENAKRKAAEKLAKIEEERNARRLEKEIRDREQQLEKLSDVLEKIEDRSKTDDQRRLDEIRDQRNEEFLILKDALDQQLLSREEYDAAVRKLDAEYDKDLRDLRKKQLAEELKRLDTVKDALFKGLEQRRERQDKTIDAELDSIDRSIRIQSQLAAAGLDNTLAFQEKRRAEFLDKKAQQERKAAKEAEARELAEIFLEFVKGFAKTGDRQANAKALIETLVAKGITRAISGSFAEGVEDFRGAGTGTSDSNLIRFSKGESAVTAEATDSYPGLPTAMNSGTVDSWVKTNAPRMGLQSANAPLIPYLRRIEKAVQESGIQVDWDKHDRRVERSIQDGIRREITKIRSKWLS